MQSSTVNGKKLGAQECQDAFFLKYGLEHPYLSKYCDGCNAAFSIYHDLDCKRGSTTMEGHNDICDGVADLDGKDFIPNRVHDNPLIFAVFAAKRGKSEPNRSKTTPSTKQLEATEQKNDLLICDLW